MAITFQSRTTAKAATSSVSIAFPASIAAGDFLLLVVVDQATPTTDPPAGGWTSCGTPIAGSAQIIRCYYKVADGTESGTNQSVVWPGAVNYQVTIIRFTPTAGSLFSSTSHWQTWLHSGTQATSVAPATAAPAGAMSVSIGGCYNSPVAPSATESGSWTEICDLAQGTPHEGMAVAYLAGATPAACTFSWSSTPTGDEIAASFYFTEAVSSLDSPFFWSM